MNVLEYCKANVEDSFKKILDVIYLYYQLDDITDFKLDLQLYNQQEYKSEPRIWLTNDTNNLGINLMLYSIKLSTHNETLPNKEAIEVFSEYMQFYFENANLFELWKNENDSYKPNANITFEISNRE